MLACTLLQQVVDMSKTIVDIPEWFHGCQLNYAENLLKHEEDKVALITYGRLRLLQCSQNYYENVENNHTHHSLFFPTKTPPPSPCR